MSSAQLKRAMVYLGGLGTLILVIGGAASGGTTSWLVIVGAVVALLGAIAAVFAALRAHEMGWLAYIGGVFVAGILLSLIVLKEFNLVTVFSLLGLAAFVYGVTKSPTVVSRGAIGANGLLSIVTLVIGGTVLNQSLGDYNAAAGTHYGIALYIVSGVIGAVGWITGIMFAARIGAWGWFVVVLLLTAIGACMFGFFGPTAQDVRQARESAEQRRLAQRNRAAPTVER